MSIEEKVEKALESVRPALQQDGGDVKLVEVRGDTAVVELVGACQGCPAAGTTLRSLVGKAIAENVPEIKSIEELGGAHQTPPPQQQPQPKNPFADQKRIPGIDKVLMVASGKGGVGKSTVAANLALALARQGQRVGLMDADIYGPSIPTMLDVGPDEQPKADEQGAEPIERHGVKLMSIGFFIDPLQPVIWRGPMVNKAIEQFLGDVRWGELDLLVVDLPPGTGDATLSLVQQVPVDGAVVVTTPSDVALHDVVRAVGMFSQIQVPVIGVIENMSHFICPHCGEVTEVFSRGGGKAIADRLRVPYLGELPLDPDIRAGGDVGRPVVVEQPDGAQAKAFGELAGLVNAFWKDGGDAR
jgi:ATP-binding protein involved in chromosome partitioning